MKPQDIGLLILLCVLILLRRTKVCIVAGLICFLLAIPLFAQWIFFTAERLVWYGALFVFLGIIGEVIQRKET